MSSRTFTGRHFAIIIGTGFAIVIAVNMALAVLASRSHPGMVVESSYIASQKFNSWLAAGARQKALGWTVVVQTDGPLLSVRATNALGKPLEGAGGEARFRHPLGSSEALVAPLTPQPDGRYVARHALPPGQWDVEVRLHRGADRHYLKQRIVVSG